MVFNMLGIFILYVFMYPIKDACGDEGVRKPVWNIAHMVNARYQVDYFLDRGANGLEFDISFDGNGVAIFTFHGMPCDCFRSCTHYEHFISFVDYLRRLSTPGDVIFRSELVLLLMDLKVSGLSPEALTNAGEDMATKLLDYYWQRGSSAASTYIVISISSIQNIEVIQSFRRTLKSQNASHYESMLGFDFSGNEDLDNIKNRLLSIQNMSNIWQGDGITNCLPRGTGRLLEAIKRRDDPHEAVIQKVYWWTVDRKGTMRKTLRLGADALLTNYPGRFIDVLNEEEFSFNFRLATLKDNPWNRYSL